MNDKQRRAVIALALVGTVAAAVFAPQGEDVAAPVERARRSPHLPGAQDARAAADRTQSALQHRRLREDAAPVFELRSWQGTVARAPAPKAVLAAAPAPPPQAPSAPFRILGRFVEDGVTGVFVQYNDRMLVARAGDIIGETYRLESIADQSITVLYLPMNVTQTISSGAVN